MDGSGTGTERRAHEARPGGTPGHLVAGVILLAVATIGAPCGQGNSKPLPPTFAVTSQLGDQLQGIVDPCQDDGKPDPPAACELTVWVVSAGAGAEGTPLGSGVSTLGGSGGAWSVTGLSEGTIYDVWVRASDGATYRQTVQEGVSTNAAPAASSFSGIQAPNRSTISGSLGSCSDDGLPGGSCTQTVRAHPKGTTCTSSCSCSSSAVASSGVASGSWSIGGLDPDTEYEIYGENEDGDLDRCFHGGTVLTPTTLAGCFKHFAIQHTQLPSSWLNPPSNVRGARATVKITDLVAPDALFGGFTLQGLWAGVAEESSAEEWIEVGVTRGFNDTNALTFYTARGNLNSNPEYYAEFAIPGTVTVDSTAEFLIINCAGNYPGCPPWDPQDSPETFLVCVAGSCFTWIDSDLAPGTINFHLGYESTCSPSARVDTATVKDIQYRFLGNWANLHNAGVSASFIGKDPSSASYHGVECCGSSTGSSCNSPMDFRYWLNSQDLTNACDP